MTSEQGLSGEDLYWFSEFVNALKAHPPRKRCFSVQNRGPVLNLRRRPAESRQGVTFPACRLREPADGVVGNGG